MNVMNAAAPMNVKFAAQPMNKGMNAGQPQAAPMAAPMNKMNAQAPALKFGGKDQCASCGGAGATFSRLA